MLAPMQDRYAFDLGDFSKFGLLRALRGVGRIGVLWYLNPHLGERERANGDGRHLQHLDPARGDEFRVCDRDLHGGMVAGYSAAKRSVAFLAAASGLGSATFVAEKLPARGQVAERATWFAAALQACAGCELVCCDPDNGLARPGTVNERRASPKHILLAEVEALVRHGHSLVLYHHFARRPHDLQAVELHALLSDRCALPVTILRWNTVSPRAYAVVAQPRHQAALAAGIGQLLAGEWGTRGHFRRMSVTV